MITLTENAAKQIGALQKEQNAAGKPLRVYVEAGGCSGMEYGMAFDEKKADDMKDYKDRVLEKAMEYIRGKLSDAPAQGAGQANPQGAVPAPAREGVEGILDAAWASDSTCSAHG